MTYKELVDKILNTYEQKNRDYGNSFDQSLNRFGLVAAIVRMGDKMHRLETLLHTAQSVSDESVVDTVEDLANYAIMTAVWLHNYETNKEKGFY